MNKYIIQSGLSIIALLAIAGCAAGRPAHLGTSAADKLETLEASAAGALQLAANTRAVAIDLPAALAEIDALTTPADVDSAVFAQLQAELARLLGETEAETEQLQYSAARQSSAAPIDDFSEYGLRPTITFDSKLQRIIAEYCVDGDYDQNGLVNAADLVPLSKLLGTMALASRYMRHIDGDRNGVINLADIVPIARHYNESPQMQLYGSTDIRDYPSLGMAPTSIAPLATLPLSREETAAGDSLLKYTYGNFPTAVRMYYWTGTADSRRVSQLAFDAETMQYDWFSHLSYDPTSGILSYDEFGAGDYDRNYATTIADIDDTAYYWGSSYGALDDAYYLRSIDFNQDGNIGIVDVTSVPLFLGVFRPTLHVYVSMDESAQPADEQLPLTGGAQPYAQFSTQSIGNGSPPLTDFSSIEEYHQSEWYLNFEAQLPESLLWHEINLPDLPSGAWLWLRPVITLPGSSKQLLGYPSEVIQIP